MINNEIINSKTEKEMKKQVSAIERIIPLSFLILSFLCDLLWLLTDNWFFKNFTLILGIYAVIICCLIFIIKRRIFFLIIGIMSIVISTGFISGIFHNTQIKQVIDLQNHGMKYYENMKYDKALESYSTALAVYKEIGDKKKLDVNQEGTLLYLIGLVHEAREEYDLALEDPTRIPRHKGFLENEIGIMYSEQEEYDQALNYFNKSLSFFEGSLNAGIILCHMADIKKSEGQNERASELYGEAYILFKNQGDEAAREGNIKGAREVYNRVLAAAATEVDEKTILNALKSIEEK